MKHVTLLALAALSMMTIACADERPAPVVPPVPTNVARTVVPVNVVTELASPAPAGAAEPFLAGTRDGGVLLSWLEPVGGSENVALRFARFHGEQWSAPRTIVQRNDLVANWADFPSIIEDANGTLYAHWLQKSGGSGYSYDVWLGISRDAGATWGKPFLLNRDGKQGEHGFVTLAALPERGVGVTWLDGRNTSGHGHGHEGGAMTIRYANVDANGAVTNETELDARVCDCCTTGMAMTSAGPVIAYRDRSTAEIRDISYVRADGSKWSAPRPVRIDGWKITGCPVNGPQVDARGAHAVTAWFTAANDQPRVYAAFSSDAGATFRDAIRIDEGKPLGRVDVLMLDATTALVTWLEQTAAGAEIRARRVSIDAPPERSIKIADGSAARGAGFTRIARTEGAAWFTWTEQASNSKRVRVARLGM